MEPLRELFQYHAWATLRLIDHCMGLSEALVQESVPGTYGPIVHTFTHLVGADQRYLELLTNEPPEAPISREEVLPLADVRARFEAQIPRWNALLDRVGELDVTLPPRWSWSETPHAQNLLIGQAIHHGNDHRTHVCTMLSVLGVEVPDIDVWSYWDVTYKTGS